jgi:hypothetical protein
MKNFQKFDFNIDSSDWRNNESDRERAVDLLINAVNELDEEEAGAIAAFLAAEFRSGGDFDFSNGATGNAYADKMSQKMHQMQAAAFNEATKDWRSAPDCGYNLFLHVK